ncbi:BhlA/UviB family holin-like peptide [Clostridium sp. UBA1652]|uniref:BhlA/UviB family holin-like peptide n=1 Tax=Clostridium sp. UBA1652 TaxID=1946348 RepID=UPI00258002FD|nr:BhlA/UviB family holin-like peptide [Clostridium sp. UBA1652]
MEEQILKLASTQGIWAVLSFILIYYIVKTQEKRDIRQEERETNYQDIINKLTDKLNILDDIQENIKDIKNINQK